MQRGTLRETEARLGPAVVVALLALWAAALALLAISWSASADVAGRLATALAGLVWLASCCLTVVNVVRSGHTTVGSVPVALCAVVPPAAVACLLVRGPARLAALVLAALGLACAVFLARWFRLMRAACLRDGGVGADAVVICLGGAVRRGLPLPTLRARLDACLALAREGAGRTIVCTGGPADGEDASEAEVMRRYLVSCGLDDERILVEDTARTTTANIERSVELVRAAGLTGELCVCTSDYHLFRAIAEGRRLGVRLTGVPAATPWPSRLEQWSREALTCAYHGLGPR